MKTIVIEEKQELESVILQSDVCFVGITDLEGNPYVIPMNFGYANEVLYLHSGPEGGKIKMLEQNNKVCITFRVGHELVYQHKQVACSYSMKSKSVMCRGKVTFIESMEEKRQALDVMMQHYSQDSFNYSDPAVRNVKVWKVAIERMSGKSFGLEAKNMP